MEKPGEVLEPLSGKMTADTGGKDNRETVALSNRPDELYGCLKFRPRFLQFMNTIKWHVLWNCIFNFFEGFTVSGVINVIIPALEKRYELSSSKSAIIASANDFGAVILYMAVGYFGEQRHKPKIMASGILLMSLGSFFFALPHYIGENYEYTVSDANSNNTQNLCSTSPTEDTCTDIETTSNTGYYVCFLIGQIFLGIGAVPMFTVGLTYIDENCKPKLTSFYLGQSFCATSVGVAVGYIVGGQSLSYFVDVNKADVTGVPLTPRDPQWVGAWWIGIILSLFAFLLVALPILGYPRQLPGYEKLQRIRKSEAHDDGTEQLTASAKFGKSWRDFPRALLLLNVSYGLLPLTTDGEWTRPSEENSAVKEKTGDTNSYKWVKNPTFLLLCLGASMEALLIGGLATFGSKLIQEYYHVDLTQAGLVIGIVLIPGSGGGMLIGGYAVKRLNLKCRGIMKLCVVCMIISMLFAPSFLASCPSQLMAGVTSPYRYESETDLVSNCNQDCNCTTSGYEPVCDGNMTVYFSPCHAGCFHTSDVEGVKKYHNCSCTLDSYPGLKSVYSGIQGTATSGNCAGSCAWFYIFCVLLFFNMLFTFMTMSPGVTAIFRCVPYKQRSLAMGTELVFIRLLGTTPGPVLLGAILDSACSVWQVKCGTTGSCWIYNKFDLGLRMVIWWAGLKLLGIIFYVIAIKVYKPPSDEEKTFDVNETNNKLLSVSEEDQKKYYPHVSTNL